MMCRSVTVITGGAESRRGGKTHAKFPSGTFETVDQDLRAVASSHTAALGPVKGNGRDGFEEVKLGGGYTCHTGYMLWF